MINTKNISIKTFFEEAKKELCITKERNALLQNLADTIYNELIDREKININFICTHNSRRSQFAQVWSFFAVEYFNLKNIFTFSGGTETTAFHRNTVKCLQHTGFTFNVIDFSHQNPKYLISFKGSKKSIIGFSKVFDHPNNQFPFIAITTCDNADENCPFIPDVITRFHTPYIDPKNSDNTAKTKETYLKTSKEIAGEMFVVFETLQQKLIRQKDISF